MNLIVSEFAIDLRAPSNPQNHRGMGGKAQNHAVKSLVDLNAIEWLRPNAKRTSSLKPTR
jgi:hypothetical protein